MLISDHAKRLARCRAHASPSEGRDEDVGDELFCAGEIVRKSGREAADVHALAKSMTARRDKVGEVKGRVRAPVRERTSAVSSSVPLLPTPLFSLQCCSPQGCTRRPHHTISSLFTILPTSLFHAYLCMPHVRKLAAPPSFRLSPRAYALVWSVVILLGVGFSIQHSADVPAFTDICCCSPRTCPRMEAKH